MFQSVLIRLKMAEFKTLQRKMFERRRNGEKEQNCDAARHQRLRARVLQVGVIRSDVD